ncbi:CaiF/GrlA family transcriptional regulator [Serratia marcescens]|uniref:CaiF/GrlA family transcriptional regulator n=1 Tax=Serratia marcescens TaxID=615 RepID=UPI00374E5171
MTDGIDNAGPIDMQENTRAAEHVTVSGKQSNHDCFYLPACLGHLIDPPLYLAVARWGLLTGTRLTRRGISEAFRISERRAADVMNYILRDRGDVIDCVRTVTREGKGRRGLTLTVVAIRAQDAVVAAAPLRTRRGTLPRGADTTRELRQWFLSRPNPESPK